MDYLCQYKSPLGPVTLACDGASLTGLWFNDQKHFGSTLGSEITDLDFTHRVLHKQDEPDEVRELFKQTTVWLDRYFDGKKPGFTPPLNLIGTVFQQSVWKALLTIPYGETRSYSQLASLIALRRKLGTDHTEGCGTRTSPRAVGMAVGRNPISIIIPCHRIVGSDDSLTGYAGGINRKISLLALEKISLS